MDGFRRIMIVGGPEYPIGPFTEAEVLNGAQAVVDTRGVAYARAGSTVRATGGAVYAYDGSTVIVEGRCVIYAYPGATIKDPNLQAQLYVYRATRDKGGPMIVYYNGIELVVSLSAKGDERLLQYHNGVLVEVPVSKAKS
jgi:hypothetical protein